MVNAFMCEPDLSGWNDCFFDSWVMLVRALTKIMSGNPFFGRKCEQCRPFPGIASVGVTDAGTTQIVDIVGGAVRSLIT
jgi:hypothetical protein